MSNAQTTLETKKVTEKKDIVDNYLLLGAPLSGKTTYFCCMAEYLQRLATSCGRFGFKFCDNHTARFINTQMKLLRNGEWPVKTPKKDQQDYRFQLDYEKRILGIKFYTECVDILYHDYPGEAFNDAFLDTSSGRYESDVKDLKEKILFAKGIFLMLDVKDIFNEKNVDALQEALFAMIKYLKNETIRPPKLALIFNKIELIPNYSHDEYVEKFKKLFMHVYQWLCDMEYKFFSVYTLGGECQTSEAGKIIPPKELHPRWVEEPVNWMIHFIGKRSLYVSQSLDDAREIDNSSDCCYNNRFSFLGRLCNHLQNH